MPFTFSHPAIVFPFRRGLSLTGLIIGSMSPDFEYFITMRISSTHGHSLLGLFYYDLPISIAIAFLFHVFIRKDFILHLPSPLKSRLLPYADFDWITTFKKKYILIIVSMIVGSLSHILWDSFTHETGFFVSKIAFLRETLILYNINLPIYKLAQHSSTIIGAFVLGYYYFQLPQAKSQTVFSKDNYWLSVFGITIVVVLLVFLFSDRSRNLGNCIVIFIPSLFYGLLLTSFFMKKKRPSTL